MGRRSRQSFLKRAKEKKRQEKAALKRERRLARKQAKVTDALSTAEGNVCNPDTGAEGQAAATATALVLVGLQNDFFPGGALAVPAADEVLPVANLLIEQFSRAALPIIAIRDWHPSTHCSFTEEGGPWPSHCVADTPGARFHPELRIPGDTPIITINARLDEDAFSGFHATDLATTLRALDVAKIIVCGLATDHFVRATALDGRSEGFEVAVVQEGIRGVDDRPEESVEALREMESAGVEITSAGTVIASLVI